MKTPEVKSKHKSCWSYGYILNQSDLKYNESDIIDFYYNSIENIIKSNSNENQTLDSFIILRAKMINGVYYFYRHKPDYRAAIKKLIMNYNFKEINHIKKILLNHPIITETNNIDLASISIIKIIKGFDMLLFNGTPFNEIKDEMLEASRIIIKGITR